MYWEVKRLSGSVIWLDSRKLWRTVVQHIGIVIMAEGGAPYLPGNAAILNNRLNGY